MIQPSPILSSNDRGKPKNGALLIAPYGKGHYIYTGLSFLENYLKVLLVHINYFLI
jgi:hypothetical protein